MVILPDETLHIFIQSLYAESIQVRPDKRAMTSSCLELQSSLAPKQILLRYMHEMMSEIRVRVSWWRRCYAEWDHFEVKVQRHHPATATHAASIAVWQDVSHWWTCKVFLRTPSFVLAGIIRRGNSQDCKFMPSMTKAKWLKRVMSMKVVFTRIECWGCCLSAKCSVVLQGGGAMSRTSHGRHHGRIWRIPSGRLEMWCMPTLSGTRKVCILTQLGISFVSRP